jgi:hypothetical protein
VTIGVALVMIAIGAILRWAVTGTFSWLNVQTAGLVLVVVGAVGLVAALYQAFILGVDRPPPPPM